MNTWITEALETAATASSRELDQACEEIGQRLIDEGIEPTWTLTSTDFDSDTALISADRYWRLRFLAAPSVRTAFECARWLGEHCEPEHYPVIQQKWSLGYAFITKDNVESSRDLAEVTGPFMSNDHGASSVAFFATLYHAGKLRAGFCFEELDDFLHSSFLAIAAGEHRKEPIFVALRGFAAFGKPSVTAAHAIELMEQAWSAPERTRHVVDVCLNGLFVATPFDGHGQLLRDRAEQAIAEYPRDHIFHYRLATGLRMCRDFDGALRNIDAALSHLPKAGTRGSHKELLEQYMFERNAIGVARQLSAMADEQAERAARQESDAADLRQTMNSSTARTIEVVAFFVSAIAFAVGALQVTLIGDLPLGDRAVLLAMFGGGLILFAGLILTGVTLINRRRKP